MALRKCGFETFGKRDSKAGSRFLGSKEADIQRLVELYEKLDIFPKPNATPRKLTHNYFWDVVPRPKTTHSEKNKKKESGTMSQSDGRYFSNTCQSKLERDNAVSGDCATFGDSGEKLESMASTNVSSCSVGYVGNILNEEEDLTDWETLDDVDVQVRPETIKESLNHLGNDKKWSMSAHVLKDHLGEDAMDMVENIKSQHDEKCRREKQKIGMIYSCCKQYDDWYMLQKAELEKSIQISKSNTFIPRVYTWRDKYNKIMERE